MKNKVLKKFLALMIMIISTFIFIGCSNKDMSTAKEENGKVKAVASFYAMEELTKAIGGDKVEIHTIIPDGVEPHDFEPKAKDLTTLENADLLVLNGAGMESWSDNVLNIINNKKLKVVDTSKGVDIIKISEESNSKEEEHHHGLDPHIWLSPSMAKIQSKNIKDALVEIDSSNKDYYEKNYENFSKELDKISEEYKDKFATVKNKNFITGHETFGYLCREFGLNQYAVEGVFAEGEPSPKKLKELTDLCKEKNINTVFVESLVSPAISETLAKEINGKTEKIYTIHSKEDNLNYIDAMKHNLNAIYSNLK